MADDLERRLREPAPDEPADLPPLRLPIERTDLRAVEGRTRPSRVGNGRPGRGSLIGLAGLVVSLLLVGVVLTGSPSPAPDATDLPSATQDATPTTVGTVAPGTPSANAGLKEVDYGTLHFSYPAAWHQLTGMMPFSGGSIIVTVGSLPVDGCGDPPELDCMNAKPLVAGEIRVLVTAGFMRSGTLDDIAPPGGWVDAIDTMPAKVKTEEGSAGVGADVLRTWTIAMPGEVAAYYQVSGFIKDPGRDEAVARLDAVARSFRFDDKPEPLDPSEAETVLRLAVDAADRSAREQSIDFYKCFPRVVGRQPVTIRSWAGGPLAAPVPVTCGSAIEPTAAGVWLVTLTVTWEAGDGYPAGEWRYALYVDATGRSSREEVLTPNDPIPEPRAETPAPVASMRPIPSRSVVEVLWPGVIATLTPDPDGDGLSEVNAGQHLYVVAGPEAHDGVDWYRVQWAPTPSYPAILGWVPAIDRAHHPLLRVVAASCPIGALDVPDLLALIPAERLAASAGVSSHSVPCRRANEPRE